METVAESIPFTAWEQAVFVALFIVMVCGLLYWFTKQSDKWQKFMFDIDEKWRAFNKEQRAENNCRMEDVNKSITNLAMVTQDLVQEVREMRDDSREFYKLFAAHDVQAKEIKDMVSNGKPTPKPRPKKVE
jgi:preprotein translocase subunit SecF